MKKTYESPKLMELGDFHANTGEWFGPHLERVLFFRDWSDEGDT